MLRCTRPFAVLLAAFALAVAAGVRADQDGSASEQKPTFRSAVDLLQLDVSVMDAKRRPIRGLTARDFTILEDGKPRPVETLLEIDIPPAPRADRVAAWTDSVEQDVVSSQTVAAAKRIVVIVIDDLSVLRSGVKEAYVIQMTRDIASAAIRDLGPSDFGAVVHTNNNFSSQSLTTDHARLLTAIEKNALVPGGEDGASGECKCNLCAPETLESVAKGLGTVPNLRKTVIYVSAGINPPPPMDVLGCHEPYMRAITSTFSEAQRANVNIHAFDPTGLRVSAGGPAMTAATAGSYRTTMGISERVEYLKMVAESTGGRVIVNNNDPQLRVTEVLEESRSYYLLGFEPADLTADGRTRKLEVRINRRDVRVEARKGYVVPRPGEPGIDRRNAAALLPDTAIAMDANASAFAGQEGKAAVALVLGVTLPEAIVGGGTVNLVGRVVNQFGEDKGTLRQTFAFRDVSEVGGKRYEMLSTLPLPPGRYDVRLALETSDGELSGVNVPVTVPDFRKQRLSVSGLVLTAMPSPTVVPRDELAGLLPLIPTTRRTFRSTDSVTAFLRAYQTGNRPAASAAVEVKDVAGTRVFSEQTALTSVTIDGLRTSDYSIVLPVDRFPAGSYLLSVAVTSGQDRLERALRFSMQD